MPNIACYHSFMEPRLKMMMMIMMMMIIIIMIIIAGQNCIWGTAQ
jgi:hypothetical protein